MPIPASLNKAVGLSGKRVADIGCGGGILAESMARRGAQVTGIDLGERALSVARLHLLECGENLALDYRLISAEALAQEMPASFDVVTCMDMLEHVPDPLSVVRACATLVKPGGQVFLSTINRNPKAYLFAVVGADKTFTTLTVIDSGNVSVGVDKNGDGSVDETLTTTWAALMARI